jgi:hypothetical protein
LRMDARIVKVTVRDFRRGTINGPVGKQIW